MRQLGLPERRADCLSRELDGEIVVYDSERHTGHCLSPTAAAVWKLCDGHHTASQMTKELSGRFTTRMEPSVVDFVLQQLAKVHLLVESGTAATWPSRRVAIRRIGIATAIALPLITSIVAPTPAQSATCATLGQPCASNAQCCSHLCDTAATHRCL